MNGGEISLPVVWDNKVNYCFYCYIILSSL